MTYQTLSTRTQGRVLLIGLNRAAKRNAFNLQMLRELGEAYTRYEQDDALWCAVLYAEGDHFTAGLDLAEVAPLVQNGAEGLFPDGLVDPVDLRGPRRTKPVVCAVQGYCFTLGIELLLASDIRIAADSTRFSQMEVKRGIAPFCGATLRFQKVTGWGNAMRYLLTGDDFDAATALRIGLVQEVTPHGAQLDAAIAIAERIAAQAPLAVRETLLRCRIAVEQGHDAANASMVDAARALMATHDAAEGVQSFVERRAARFTGK
jgi:enoyl-CoA hydratase/carnithine racemase